MLGKLDDDGPLLGLKLGFTELEGPVLATTLGADEG